MQIHDVEFTTSAVTSEHYPEDFLPEIVFVGRSNVGKSSLINSILGRKNIAYTSSKPGKTQTINFFKINKAFYFVDVPGYGYAKRSKKDIAAFTQMIDEYLLEREQLRLVFQLVDFRHPPTKADQNMFHYLATYNIPTIVIGTKMDKVPKTKRLKQEEELLKTLGIKKHQFIPFSALTKENIEWIYDVIEQAIQ
ncbi:MAG: ribosome biogenesis GTP-binding protein YihA/YsxC [Candidatus Izimaplasma sp.]|nr:ribosome biogenesis GTP-binding protein YihA/YsxC [Candidatus Izimaplasma bacterium]